MHYRRPIFLYCFAIMWSPGQVSNSVVKCVIQIIILCSTRWTLCNLSVWQWRAAPIYIAKMQHQSLCGRLATAVHSCVRCELTRTSRLNNTDGADNVLNLVLCIIVLVMYVWGCHLNYESDAAILGKEQEFALEYLIWLRMVTKLSSSDRSYRDANSLSFDNMCETANERLFSRIVNNSLHPLHSLLPPQRDQHYELRERAHNFQLHPRFSSLTDSNFLTRMLFKNTGCAPWPSLTYYITYKLYAYLLLYWLT